MDNEYAPQNLLNVFEVGWLFWDKAWGYGFASEAAAASILYAHHKFSPPLIVALTSENNRPSWAMMERLGMVRHKEWDFHDPYFPAETNPTIIYAIDRKGMEALADRYSF